MPEPPRDTKTLAMDDVETARALAGAGSQNLREVEGELGVKITLKGDRIDVTGDAFTAGLAVDTLRELYAIVKQGFPLYPSDVKRAVGIVSQKSPAEVRKVMLDTIYVTPSKRRIVPKTPGQKQYVDAMRKSDMVFARGPAGTGKTYLAMAMAVSAMKSKKVKRLILTRPAVEAGERLGFLPGDLVEKVNPYLRPLYDALHDMMDLKKVLRLVKDGMIEVAPLAFMRGRTLNDAFVILDEAQNTTPDQMKMFLTRLGYGSSAVVTGDVTQVDLPNGQPSGMVHAMDVLQGVKGIELVHLTREDVVRHPLVQRVVDAYERFDRRHDGEQGRGGTGPQ